MGRPTHFLIIKINAISEISTIKAVPTPIIVKVVARLRSILLNMVKDKKLIWNTLKFYPTLV